MMNVTLHCIATIHIHISEFFHDDVIRNYQLCIFIKPWERWGPVLTIPYAHIVVSNSTGEKNSKPKNTNPVENRLQTIAPSHSFAIYYRFGAETGPFRVDVSLFWTPWPPAFWIPTAIRPVLRQRRTSTVPLVDSCAPAELLLDTPDPRRRIHGDSGCAPFAGGSTRRFPNIGPYDSLWGPRAWSHTNGLHISQAADVPLGLCVECSW